MKPIAQTTQEKRPASPEKDPMPPAKKACFAQTPNRFSERKPLEVTLKQPYLSLIKSGKKTVEGRIASGMFSSISPGSTIRFFNKFDQVLCSVTSIAKYSSFAQMLHGEGVEKCLPGSSMEAGIRTYESIPGYKERAAQHGVLAIRVKVEGKEKP